MDIPPSNRNSGCVSDRLPMPVNALAFPAGTVVFADCLPHVFLTFAAILSILILVNFVYGTTRSDRTLPERRTYCRDGAGRQKGDAVLPFSQPPPERPCSAPDSNNYAVNVYACEKRESRDEAAALGQADLLRPHAPQAVHSDCRRPCAFPGVAVFPAF